jgi:hypothetical protein
LKLRRHLRRLAELNGQEWEWLAWSLVLLPAAWFSLKVSGWVKTMRRFEGLAGPVVLAAPATLNGALSTQAARVVRLAATFGPFRVLCLPRSVVLWTLLRREGFNPAVKLGVRKGDQGFDAHAWVEVDGVSLDDPADEPFTALSTPPFSQPVIR